MRARPSIPACPSEGGLAGNDQFRIVRNPDPARNEVNRATPGRLSPFCHTLFIFFVRGLVHRQSEWVFRWVARRAGWNSTAAESVVTSASAISLPMLEVPGWRETHRRA